MNRIVSVLALLLVVGNSFAQNYIDLVTLSGRYSTPAVYDSVHAGKGQELGSFVALTLPIRLSKKTIFYNSINYFYFNVDNEPTLDPGIADGLSLHAYILRSGIVQRFDGGQSLQLLIAPRFMTSMEGGGSEGFQIGGVAMYEKVHSEKLTLGFGALYNQEEFGPYFVPVVNLKWKPFERFSITGLLPVYAKINFHISKKLTTGISHFGLTTTFPLNGDGYENDYLERQSIDLALFGK